MRITAGSQARLLITASCCDQYKPQNNQFLLPGLFCRSCNREQPMLRQELGMELLPHCGWDRSEPPAHPSSLPGALTDTQVAFLTQSRTLLFLILPTLSSNGCQALITFFSFQHWLEFTKSIVKQMRGECCRWSGQTVLLPSWMYSHFLQPVLSGVNSQPLSQEQVPPKAVLVG